MTISTDAELDRLISVRLSKMVPFPKDVSFGLVEHVDMFSIYSLYGLDEHPFIKRMKEVSERVAMASVMRSAPYMERVAHYVASLPSERMDLIDMRKIASSGRVFTEPAERVVGVSTINERNLGIGGPAGTQPLSADGGGGGPPDTSGGTNLLNRPTDDPSLKAGERAVRLTGESAKNHADDDPHSNDLSETQSDGNSECDSQLYGDGDSGGEG